MRDFQAVVDSIAAMTCVVSVEKLPDGRCGKFRIVTGNKSYIDSIENPMGGVEMLSRKFVPNSEYTDYMTRDLNFEDYCYRAAVEKKCLHSYVHPDRYDVWFNMTFLPLGPDDGNICYCTYTMEINFEANSERLSNVSGELASAVLETTISLRETKDFQATMQHVVHDILELCEGEYIGILLVDTEGETCSLLCEDIVEGSSLKNRTESIEDDFYKVASTWADTIAGSNCLIVKNEQDLDVVRERNPLWYQSLKDAGVRSVALFPLKSHTQILGYMWISNFDPSQTTRIKETLELTTFILASEIANRLLLDQLRIMGSRDMLTGVLNRNEMNHHVERLSEIPEGKDSSVGVLFADLNGLKTVNDELGHPAGDQLLRDAAAVLCEVFEPDQIFRAGGDEFTIIMLDTSPEELEHKMAVIKEVSTHYEHVNFAVGSCFDSSCRNVRHALTLADQRMYEDKKQYYREKERVRA